MSHALVAFTDIMMMPTVLSMWFVLVRARRDGMSALGFGIAYGIALAWGLVWMFHPTFIAWRALPPPLGQGVAIGSLVLSLVAMLALPTLRAYAATVDAASFLVLGPWRIFYGAILLALGVGGALPPAFFWSSAIGDIFTGLWAIWLMTRNTPPSRNMLLAWNAFGLADLVFAIGRGAFSLLPFYAANPGVAPQNLLPLVGVPLFIALHIWMIWGLLNRAKEARAVSVDVN
jgi:hypothetical protein